jgi:hypothetical protein
MGFKEYLGRAVLGAGLAAGAACAPEKPPVAPISVDDKAPVEAPMSPEDVAKMEKVKQEIVHTFFETETVGQPTKEAYDTVDQAFRTGVRPEDLGNYIMTLPKEDRRAAADGMASKFKKFAEHLFHDPLAFKQMAEEGRPLCLTVPKGLPEYCQSIIDILGSDFSGQ